MEGTSYQDVDVISMDLQNLIVRSSKKGQLNRALSRSTPSVADNFQTLTTISASSTSLSIPVSSAREKKFHRYFDQVPIEEPVLSYHRCALVRDILLQGHLYVTPNYFSFYSNIFGYVTKLVIPMSSVTEISKQKTVKLIPNAITIATKENRHIFCSLYWKDSTFKRIIQVWEDTRDPKPVTDTLDAEELMVSNSDAESDEDHFNYLEIDNETEQNLTSQTCKNSNGITARIWKPASTIRRIQHCLRLNITITILIVLLVFLVASAAVMMMRIDRLYRAYHNHPLLSAESAIQKHFSQHLHLSLHQLDKVRQKLSEHVVSMTDNPEWRPIFSEVLDREETLD